MSSFRKSCLLTLRVMIRGRATMGRNGRDFYQRELSFAAGVHAIERAMLDLAQRP